MDSLSTQCILRCRWRRQPPVANSQQGVILQPGGCVGGIKSLATKLLHHEELQDKLSGSIKSGKFLTSRATTNSSRSTCFMGFFLVP
jgi:hypothetical protein